MDRRGWLWKKKSSDKSKIAEKPGSEAEPVSFTLSSVANLEDEDSGKNKNYVQISMESYTHMCALEDQVKALEDKLTTAYSELNSKDNLVKQHATVAEEAVSGWEKADAEVASLRCQLESVTISKLAVEDRASHLDGALKECMKQIRTVKEDSEQKLQDLILMKSQQWEKVKSEFEVKIDKLEQGLRCEASENAALLRSLQDSSNKIARLKEEKSEAEAEVEFLKKNVQSCEKEIASLKYELHVISKELDIRNEEKNMIMRSAEVASRKHAEDVRNIAKIETECQRLRGLLRRKLPGLAALAQMKLEVGIPQQVISTPYHRKTCLKADGMQESEFLAKKLEALEEETKTLKEALATSNAELQASRNLYAKTVGRLKTLEAEIQFFHLENVAEKSNLAINFGNSSNRISNKIPSLASISDDGHEEPESPVESSAASTCDLSEIKRVTSVGKFEKEKSETIIELMNDFLEVEKMACLSDNSNVALGITSKVSDSDGTDKQSDKASKVEETDYIPEKNDKASKHAEHMQDLKETKLMFQEKEQLLAELKEQLASSHKSYNLAEIQLKCMTESYKSLQMHAEYLEAQNKILQENIEELKNDLVEQKKCHDDALVRHRAIEEKMQRDKCLVCGSNLGADNGMTTGKDMELAAAEKKLAECQETLYTLGRHLQALCPHIEIPISHLGKRLQTNDMLVKPSHGWSNSNVSSNSNEIEQAEASRCSVPSEIQEVNVEFSSPNCRSTPCLSDTEGCFSVNSSIGSSKPGYMLTESNSSCSASATGKHAHGFRHFSSLKGKNAH
ncbi:hypothetical protein HN51_068710 [Arachis hypogaea]|uniref:Filament-like plant protein n=1 Tax=Arachis hypogaea TaxID=3818 RepID=A0A444Z991_ARAHY|nr:filament-like plant protein 4 [Arachis ipaensis]XP_025653577.1 filament-like plant protein 4 [Arachis hypogaea]QHO10825.1 Filament-like plant protein [Arachis hypogaea]RYR10742.1 hypothetical protein Ahy_B05g079221 [Arachis hypogaea]